MAVYFVPSIMPVEYPLFYDLCGGRLPPIFEEWVIAEELARRELVAEGHHVIGIPMAVADLRAHCRSLNCRADAAAMNAYAMNVGRATFPNYAEVRARTVIVDDLRARRTVAGQPDIVETPVVVETVPARRRWWNFWRRPSYVGDTEVVETTVVETVPARRHWWNFWRRPVAFDRRRRPLATRTVGPAAI